MKILNKISDFVFGKELDESTKDKYYRLGYIAGQEEASNRIEKILEGKSRNPDKSELVFSVKKEIMTERLRNERK